MDRFNEIRSAAIRDRVSVTLAGLFNEHTGALDLKPMFIGAQPPKVITDRLETIRKKANMAARNDDFKRDSQAYWLEAERTFDTHTLHVVVRNAAYGEQVFMLPMDSVCSDGERWDGTYMFAGNIPYVSRVDAIDFYRDWRHLKTFDVPRGLPAITLMWFDEMPAEGKRVINWRGHHDEGRRLSYYLVYESRRGARVPLTTLSEMNDVEVDFASLPSGVGQLILTASDGYNTAEAYSPHFYVPSRPCAAVILEPQGGAVLHADRVNFSGRGFYDDGMTEEYQDLEWVSNRDGVIGRGALVTRAALSSGRHEITLVAGLPGTASTTSIQIEVLPTDSHIA